HLLHLHYSPLVSPIVRKLFLQMETQPIQGQETSIRFIRDRVFQAGFRKSFQSESATVTAAAGRDGSVVTGYGQFVRNAESRSGRYDFFFRHRDERCAYA